MKIRTLLGAAGAVGLALCLESPVAAQAAGSVTAQAPGWAALPDWSGVWYRLGRGVFDPATADPPDALGLGEPPEPGKPPEREHPPYTPAWEAK